jgi:hypothetical protein
LWLDTKYLEVNEESVLKNVTVDGDGVQDNQVTTFAVKVNGRYDDLKITGLTVADKKAVQIGNYEKSDSAMNVTLTDSDIYAVKVTGYEECQPNVILNGGSYDYVLVRPKNAKITVNDGYVGSIRGSSYISGSNTLEQLSDEVVINGGTFGNVEYSENGVKYDLRNFVSSDSVSYSEDGLYKVADVENLSTSSLQTTFRTGISDQGTYEQVTTAQHTITDEIQNIVFTITRNDGAQATKTVSAKDFSGEVRVGLVITDVPQDQNLTVETTVE